MSDQTCSSCCLLQKQITDLTAKIQMSENIIDGMEYDLKIAENTIIRLENELEATEKKYDDLTEEFEAAKNKLIETEDDRDSYVLQLVHEQRRAKKRIEELEEARHDLHMELKERNY